MTRALASVTAIMLCTTAHAQTVYQISPGVSNGILNIRKGPSPEYGLVGAIPAGETVSVYRCVAPQVTYSKADWCEVNYQGTRGWASTTGMYPAPASAAMGYRSIAPLPPPPPQEVTIDLTCKPSILVSPSDPNPVRSIRIHATGIPGTLRRLSVTQTLLNGAQYERLEQYSVNTKLYSDISTDHYGWSGYYNKDLTVGMFGEFNASSYTETQYKNGVKQFEIITPCS